MDQKACEESGNNASNFNCTKILCGVDKILRGVDKPMACPTPEKTSEPFPTKFTEGQTQLPQKYRTIADLFNHMSCSLRLLHLCKKSPTFQNICTQVEVLANRKFSHEHLAQMKYILPESLHIDKVLIHDKKSLCMEPDMKITLKFEAVEEHSKESAYMALRRHFFSRLINFFNMHPEATDIPEAILPEPFSQRTCHLICADLPVTSSTVLSSTTSNQSELLPEKFHLYPSFSRHFSQKNVATQTEKVQCFSTTKTSPSSLESDCLDSQESERSWQNSCTPYYLKSDGAIYPNPETGHQKESCSMCSQPGIINTPAHMICPLHSVCSSSSESPDIKVVSSAESLMTETPAQSTPRRLIPSSDVKLEEMTPQKSTSCYKPAKRVLDFSCVEGNDGLDTRVDKLESSGTPHEYDGIPESSRGCYEDCDASGSITLPQKAAENLGCSLEKNNQIQADLDTWQHKSSSLLDLVNVIHFIFHSVKCSPITKEELLHKIIMNSFDFAEIGEVEEQVEFLEKLVPEWICKKLVPTGDIMYCIKKAADLDSIRSRLLSNGTMGAE